MYLKLLFLVLFFGSSLYNIGQQVILKRISFADAFPLSRVKLTIYLFNDQRSHHIETSQMICSANHLTGFYMIGTLVIKTLTQVIAA